jgi:hypothetical protein
MTPRRLSAKLAPFVAAFALAGCSAQPGPPQNLSARLQERLAPEIQANQASVQQLPDGAQVIFQRDLLFSNARPELDAKGQHTLGSVAQGLLDLRIMEIAIQSDSFHAQPVKDFFETTLRPASPNPLVNAATIVVGNGAGTATPAAGSVILRIRVVPPNPGYRVPVIS